MLSRENERGAAFPFERARQPPGAPCSTDTSRSQARDSSRSSWRARRVLRARGARLDVRRARAPRPRRSDHPRRFRARESEDRVSARRDTLTRATRRQKKAHTLIILRRVFARLRAPLFRLSSPRHAPPPRILPAADAVARPPRTHRRSRWGRKPRENIVSVRHRSAVACPAPLSLPRVAPRSRARNRRRHAADLAMPPPSPPRAPQTSSTTSPRSRATAPAPRSNSSSSTASMTSSAARARAWTSAPPPAVGSRWRPSTCR